MTDGQPDACEIVITAPDGNWMHEFSRDLISARLVAAVHLFEPIKSLYRWDGIVHYETEIRAAFHTRRSLVSLILDQVRIKHPFQVPGVVILPILGGGSEYLEWIYAETQAL